MKKIINILICCIMILFLAGCGEKVKEGYIVDKQEETGLTNDFFDYEVSKYVFYVQLCVDGDENTNKWYVSKKTYDTYGIGDYITMDKANDKNKQ